jgi:hypothetical protein
MMIDLEGCLDRHLEECEGDLHTGPSASGLTMITRCVKHWAEAEERQARIDRDYPDSATPPGWFDPADAGEYWDEDY